MSYDLGNLNLAGEKKSRRWLYVAAVVVVVLVVLGAGALAFGL